MGIEQPNQGYNDYLKDIVSKTEIAYKNTDIQASISQMQSLFMFLLQEYVQLENIHFSSTFAKMVFAANQLGISGKDLYLSHVWRRSIEQKSPSDEGQLVIGAYVNFLWCKKIDPSLQSNVLSGLSRPDIEEKGHDYGKYIGNLQFVALQIDLNQKVILGYEVSEPHKFKQVKFDVTGKNENFTGNIKLIEQYMPLPLMLHLTSVTVEEDGTFIPEGFIADPDYLIDVTAISECFNYSGICTEGHLVKKFMTIDSSLPLMIGNIANMMLDEIANDPDVTFDTVKKNIFSLHPLALSSLEDKQVIELLRKVEDHFLNLKSVFASQFQEVGINQGHIYLEPTFISTRYGVQGRLDLYHMDDDRQIYDIVELKSGKLFHANSHGINHNHYIQTMLYDMIIRHALPSKVKPKAYILYSSQSEKALKYAPPIKSQQMEAMKVRNRLRVLEHLLTETDLEESPDLFSFLDPEKVTKGFNFVKRDMQALMSSISQLDKLEYDYFIHFAGLIAREQTMAKVGTGNSGQRSGFSTLWSESIDEKKENYNAILYLEVNEITDNGDHTFIRLNRSKDYSELSRFRKGDIALLYPQVEDTENPLGAQIFKTTIIEINADSTLLRLRHKQKNQTIFNKYQYWHLGQDMLDSSFNSMYRSLYTFINSEAKCRNLILGKSAPALSGSGSLIGNYVITDIQKQVIEEAIDAQDYHLIWGPPGTGKTSKVLRTIVEELHKHRKQKILILSFTNRAVDEICNAVYDIEDIQQALLRIGSRYSTDPAYRHLLLVEQMLEINKRSELNNLLEKSQVVISTVASMHGKTEIFDKIDFDVIIVDEASQLLEPMLVGLLSKVPKWILIGDHLQLPAVVTQEASVSMTRSTLLQSECHLYNGRNSLFERLYLHCEDKGWDHAIGILSEQGRMHEEIMEFINTQFYHGQLKHIEGISRLSDNLPKFIPDVLNARLVFIPCAVEDDITKRENRDQAIQIVNILKEYQRLLHKASLSSDHWTFGVITPFRAQIALINKYIEGANLDLPINVDTVERYQGGARDVILFSTTINHQVQFRQIVSENEAGVDRKLNVAITRAKEQFILLGNEHVLDKNRLYRTLKNACKSSKISTS